MKRSPKARKADTYGEPLGRAIKVLRTEQGVGRKELAEAAGISYSYLAEIENGVKPPSSKVLMLLADALGLRPQDLFVTADSLGERRVAARGAKEEVAASFEMAWHSRVEPPRRRASSRDVTVEELMDLVGRLDEEDVRMLVELARRLAGRGGEV